MSVPPTPFPTPGQPPNWGQQLIDAIVDRFGLTNDEVDALQVLVNSGRLSQSSLDNRYALQEAYLFLTSYVNSTFNGRLSDASLKSTFAHLDGDRLSIDGDPLGPATVGAQPAGDYMPNHPTGAAGLAVLAANLPAEARDALGITVDTSVGTRVFMGGVLVHAETPWRYISQWDEAGAMDGAPLSDGYEPTPAYPGGIITRLYADKIEISISSLTRVSTTPANVFDSFVFPTGWRPRRDNVIAAPLAPFPLVIRPTGILQRATGSLVGDHGNFSPNFWTTFQVERHHHWPTTLPGTPA